jgi:hypothetical protein
MRTAPAVHLPLEADTPWRVGLCLLFALTAATLAAWAASWLRASPLLTLGAALGAALPAGMLPWRSLPAGATALAWDGTQWQLHLRDPVQTVQGRAQLMIDLGTWLLLRFVPADAALRVCWLALSRSRHGPHWHALRCALHAAVPSDAASDGPQRG